ncbi:MAG: GDPmannose 4,6-dehydratase, partial [Acidobacteriaceae bacterium]|nr:GDPmannose 4,6-dehydratase [Acidobacteriaceae bacterium]
MWRMLQQPTPQDYVIATGQQYTVREFVERAAEPLGFGLHWEGTGAGERGIDAEGRVIIVVDPRYFRPAEVETLLGDASKARRELGWEPRISFADLVSEMVTEDLKEAERDALVHKHGFNAFRYHE